MPNTIAEKAPAPVDVLLNVMAPFLTALSQILETVAKDAMAPVPLLRKHVRVRAENEVRLDITSSSDTRLYFVLEMNFSEARENPWLNKPWEGKGLNISKHEGYSKLAAGRSLVECLTIRRTINSPAVCAVPTKALMIANEIVFYSHLALQLEALANQWLEENQCEIGEALIAHMDEAYLKFRQEMSS